MKWVWLMAALWIGGCGDEQEENCTLQTAYLCENGQCYCVEDTLRSNPLPESVAMQTCEACVASPISSPSGDAIGTWGSYDRYGGVDDFSGDNQWGY